MGTAAVAAVSASHSQSIQLIADIRHKSRPHNNESNDDHMD